jgi:DNA-binding GntR family transcriptional regulator
MLREGRHKISDMATRSGTATTSGIAPPLAKGIDTARMSSGDQAALYIRRLMFDGDLRPGTRVPQDEIAQALGLSRIPVREALIALEREGWVTIELHRGAFINALDAEAVRDHYELYGLVYGFAANRALRRSSVAELIEPLNQIVKDLPAATQPEDFTRLTFAFHRTVVNAARSHRINVVIRAMSGLVPGDFFSLVPDAMPIERRGLPAIARAMAKGDHDRVADEYLRTMRRVGQKVVALFEAHGLFEQPTSQAPVERPARRRAAAEAAAANGAGAH